jgi:hypothetical protein
MALTQTRACRVEEDDRRLMESILRVVVNGRQSRTTKGEQSDHNG